MASPPPTEDSTPPNTKNDTLRRCTDCDAPLPPKHFWSRKKNAGKKCADGGCHARLCSACSHRHPLVVLPEGEDKKVSTGGDDDAKIRSYCTSCFRRLSVLDFDRDRDVIGDSSTSGITFVFAHGGGGSRAMFRPHAETLCDKYGHRSILFDLPGHGANVDVPLTLESCGDVLKKVLDESCIQPVKSEGAEDGGKKQTTIYVGASFGAYVGFDILKEYGEYFSAAILLDCGQNVGPGRSIKAGVGLFFLKSMGMRCSNETLAKGMFKTTRKSPADYRVIETTFGAGMFFDHAGEMVDCLRAVAPADIIPHLRVPILYMNGSEDYRDSEELWLSLCASGKLSDLKVYEGGDHFFTHDSRFVDDMIQRWDVFATRAATLSSKAA